MSILDNFDDSMNVKASSMNIGKQASASASRVNYPWRPLLIDASSAHQNGDVHYSSSGVVTLRNPALQGSVTIAHAHQYPCVLPTFLALDKALSSASNSPCLSSGGSLREAFDQEYHTYLDLLTDRQEGPGPWEPDYGTYVYDRRSGNLYLIAPESWHRLALVTSNAKLLTDPAGQMTAEEIRIRLSGTVVGFIGASLGSNVVEGVVREMRPLAAKLADPDYLEVTNLNRLQHGSLRYLAQPRARRAEPRNPYEALYVNKARLVAYENQLIDPYANWHLYEEGVNDQNLDDFLLGNSQEPRLDYVVEACDDLRLKMEVRRRARKYGIVVVMTSDIGHRGQAQLQDFAAKPDATLGYGISDADLQSRLNRCANGDRAAMFSFAEGLLGPGFAVDEFADWAQQKGEQPTSSIPQSGGTALLSGALGGKLIAMHRLGHKISERTIVDLRRMEMSVD